VLAQQGAAGPAGAVGPIGAQGPIGFQGPQGPTGAPGVAGINGTNGATGATGAQGIQGLTGDNGPTGPKGDKGDTGATGAMGPAGAMGAPSTVPGPAGATGPAGAQGAPGPAGANGLGPNWTGPWNAATNYNLNDAVSFNGTSYVALATSTGQEPDSTASLMNFATSGGNQYTWTLPTNPATLGSAFQSLPAVGGFEITGVTVGYVGSSWTSTATIVFYPGAPSVINGGGFEVCWTGGCATAAGLSPGAGTGGGGGFYANYSAQVWSGSISSPLFVSGTYYESFVSITLTPASSTYWNVIAQAGAAGPTGPQGPQGIQGFPGLTGSQGPEGLTGPQGLQGAASTVPGPQGPAGPAGPAASGIANVYVNTSYGQLPVSAQTGASPGLIQLTNLPVGSYLVTGAVNLAYGADPAGHSVQPWCELAAYDGGAYGINVGLLAMVTMLPPPTDRTTSNSTLSFSGTVTLVSSTNIVYVLCSLNGPWNTTFLNTQWQTITAVQANVTSSPGSVIKGTD
jgi:Collagen triple helix repeat (20 copies)